MYKESIYKDYVPEVTYRGETNTENYWFIFSSDRLLLELDDDKAAIPFAESLDELGIIAVRKQYLGMLKGHPAYSVEALSTETNSKYREYRQLYSIYGVLPEDIFLLAGKAYQIVNWDKTHHYCGVCGTETHTMEGERAKECPKCGHLSYPVIAPAVITAIIKEDKILLAHNKSFMGNMYSLIAGFVEAGETLEEAVKREIMEEVGIKVKNVRYLGSQPWPFPNSLMLGFVADYESGEIKEDGQEITSAGWFNKDNLPQLPNGISIARKIIDWYIENQH